MSRYEDLKELANNISFATRERNPGVNDLPPRIDSHMDTDANTKYFRMTNPKPTKYHAQRTDGYPSKKHAEFAAQLEMRQKAGEVWFWLEEVPFKLPGRAKHRVDFLVFYMVRGVGQKGYGRFAKGEWELVEVKGRDLPMGKLKRKQVEEIYHVKITVV